MGACGDAPVLLVNNKRMCSFMSNENDRPIAGGVEQMTQPTQVLLAGVNPSDPDNWRLRNYEQREGYVALRKILERKDPA